MWESVSSTVSEYYNFYTSYSVRRFNTMSPMEYGTVLIAIAMVGWFMMRNAARR